MEKTYKVISNYGLGDVYIEHFSTLEDAQDTFDKAIRDECEISYLLETKVRYSGTEDSANTILKIYKCEC